MITQSIETTTILYSVSKRIIKKAKTVPVWISLISLFNKQCDGIVITTLLLLL